MALRDHRLVRELVGCLVGLSLAAAFLGIWGRVRTGNWLDACGTPQMGINLCSPAFVTVLVIVVVGVPAAVTWLFRRARARRESSKGGPTNV
jgi:hypothetical protein